MAARRRLCGSWCIAALTCELPGSESVRSNSIEEYRQTVSLQHRGGIHMTIGSFSLGEHRDRPQHF